MHLTALQSESGGYNLLDLSQIYQLADKFGLALTQEEHIQHLAWIIEYVAATVSSEASGLLLGPELGFQAVQKKAADTGLVLAIEKQSELLSPNEMPKLYPHWGIEQVRNNYGVAYFRFFYHPDEPLAQQKKQLAAELYDYSQYEGIEMIIELALSDAQSQLKTDDSFAETQLFAAKEFQPLTDLLALEYPKSSLACATLTAQLDIPWILVDGKQDYPQFKEYLRIALESGASGCLTHLISWLNLPKLKLYGDPNKTTAAWATLEKYIQTELRDRLIEITRIVNEKKLESLS
ncbi:MAG TPA: hypothetical protein PKX78_00135 [Candidatus Woesebacteria bacterium]|nr:hypothetical protein [Candidatus Woesebacteria bacterium]